MIEKVIENWLDKSTERVYQIPFCYFLLKKGHTVLHISRHCGMELGKDIVTLNENNVPCAFQLKTGNISLKKWRDEISAQVNEMAYGSINHPSITSSIRHIPYLVTNGKIEEEAQYAINGFNQTLEARGLPRLEVIVKGDILKQAIELKNDLWSYNEKDFEILLRILLEDGNDIFPKKEFADILEMLFRLNVDKNKYSKPEVIRLVTNASILTSLCLSNFTKKDNHFAEVEAWTLFLSYSFCIIEKTSYETDLIQTEIEIAKKSITNSIKNLIEEMKNRKNELEGETMVDSMVIGIRRTIISSLLSVYPFLLNEQNDLISNEDKDFIREYIHSNLKKMKLWGEAAVPQFLSVIQYLKCYCGIPLNDFLLSNLVENISNANLPKSLISLPNTYYQTSDLLPNYFENELKIFLPEKYLPKSKKIRETFAGSSSTLEGLVFLYTRRLWKQQLKLLWGSISKISLNSFVIKENWKYYRYHNAEGEEFSRFFDARQEWGKLQDESNRVDLTKIPKSILKYPSFALLFLIVIPHRWGSEIVKWIDSVITKEKYC